MIYLLLLFYLSIIGCRYRVITIARADAAAFNRTCKSDFCGSILNFISGGEDPVWEWQRVSVMINI